MNECNNKERVNEKPARRVSRYEKLERFLANATMYIVLIVTFPLGIIGAILHRIFKFMDDSQLTQRAAIWIGVLLSLYAMQWAFGFIGTAATLTGTEIAGIVAAVMTPIAGLITILLKYGRNKPVDEEDKPE